jgi:hypothetical protein
MILYANGCSHTAAAEAVVPDAFAEDDGRAGIDRRPHPLNWQPVGVRIWHVILAGHWFVMQSQPAVMIALLEPPENGLPTTLTN